ncbi:hypothetical protein POM88_010463 [Heracleum sosnowskyi]|uniref:Uncharacterized protein n=1 Tax=Heracleum sosnowskyi TaxID=360622 RepID=A0AAD8IW24_9APIA|nr:hypothetical protein POM88_010463 [Heracleum sosnowskyi]
MRLQPCSMLHYINAIKGGSISKVLNVNSRRKPGLVFRNLIDIYEDDCPKHLHGPLEVALLDGRENGEVENIIESPCLPKAERITNQGDQEFNVSDCSDNDMEIVSGFDDLSFGEMTLKELRKTCKSKKRKMLDFVCLSPECQQDEDDCDLTTPLSSWNIKPSKSAKSVKKHARISASAFREHDCLYTTDQIFDPPCSQQSINANCVSIAIKVDVSQVCFSEHQIASFVDEATDGPSISDEQVNYFDMDSTILQTSDTVLENKETISLSAQYATRANTSSPSQLNDDFMPLSCLPPPSVKTAGLSTQEMFQHSSVSCVTELQKESDILQSPSTQSFPLIDEHIYDRSVVIHGIGDEVSEVPLGNGMPSTTIVNGNELCIFEDDARNRFNIFSASQSLNMPEILSNESECIVSNVATNNSLCCIESGRGVTLSVFEDVLKTNLHHYQPNGSLRSPFSYYSTPWNFYPCSASDSDLVADESDSPTTEDDWSLISYNSNTSGYCLEPDTHLTGLEDASYATEKQLLLPNTDVEISFSSNADDELSIPETNSDGDMVTWQPPERFPSTRKVISPTFKEKACLTMNYRELTEGIENHKGKGKLFPGNQTEDNALSALSDTAGVESCVTGELTEMGNKKKAFLAPKKILKKPKHNNKGALSKRCNPPIGRVSGPPLTRSVPDICNGKTSTEVCYERAIAFSQRQMQDIESIAVKLMTELKSMKDIVEEKVLHEAYHCTSMKKDADEVKSAIKGATRVEETTKKWLSMMAKDCNRFCKIMSQSQRSAADASAAKETIMRRENKKISFADEAGGVLCHVKYFENGENNTNVAS